MMSVRSSTASARLSGAGGRRRALAVAGLVLVTAVLAVLHANVFALHVGMSTSDAGAGTGRTTSPASWATTVPAGGIGLAADSPEGGDPTVAAAAVHHVAPTADTRAPAATPITGSHDGMHLLHLLGACLALLSAAVVVAVALRRSGEALPRPAASALLGPAASARARGAWTGPPALAPPTTSPVLRC